METPLHISLLKNLKNAGIGVTVDISPFIVAHFKKPIDRNPTSYNKGMRPARLFFEDLLKRGFIQFDEEFGLSEYFNVLENPANNCFKWFSDIDINIYLTSNGLDYLEKYYLEKSISHLNKTAQRNYWIQIVFSCVTIILAGLTVFLTHKNDSVDIKIYKVQRNLDSLKYEMEGMKKSILKMPLSEDSKSIKN